MAAAKDRGEGLYWLAVAVGAAYSVAAWSGWSGPAIIAWKGAGVALLALWAAMRARGIDGWLLAVALGLGALGDVLLDAAGLTVGAVAFLAGHLAAILLYARNRRAVPSSSQRLLGWLLAPLTVGIALALTRDPAVGVYAAGLGAMAAFAWTSRFPRYRVGLGAVLFVVSDLLIFARMGPLAGSPLPRLLVWPTYFAAQALIARGAARRLEQGR